MARTHKREAGKILPADSTTARTVTAKSITRSVVDHTTYFESLKSVGSKSIVDPFSPDYEVAQGGIQVLEPLYPFDKLMALYLESSLIRPCVDAYVVNIESYGHELEYIGERVDGRRPEVLEERRLLDRLLAKFGCYQSLRQARELSRVDYEVLGNRAFEIVRDQSGAIVFINALPFATIRLTRYDETPVLVTVSVPLLDGTTEQVEVIKHFRRFVQKNNTNGRRVYLKEFGDPRRMSASTGAYESDEFSVADDDLATEVIHDYQYVPGSVYGLPRWIGQMPAILGSREAELVNYEFFKDNAIPAMAVLISGGALTQDGMNQLAQHLGSRKGRKSMNRVLILEALADDSAGGSTDHSVAAPKIDLKPMISERQQEGLFQEYDEKNALKVRSAFRLSPIYTGRTDEFNRASAFASMQVAENQIFVPERMRFDAIMNERILSSYGIRYHRFKSLGAPLSDPESLSRILRALNDTGAMTPNTIIKVANQVLNIDVPDIEQEWGNVPFSVIMGFVRQGIIPTGFESFVSVMNERLGTIGNATPQPDTAGADIQKLVETVLEDMQTFANER